MKQEELEAVFAQIDKLRDHHPAIVHCVDYDLYMEEGEKVTFPDDLAKQKNVRHEHNACFASLPYLLDKELYNRIHYTPRSKCTAEEDERWIKLCLEHDMLPKSMAHSKDFKQFVLDTGIPRQLLYVYLSNIRHLEEESHIVKASILMTDKLGMDFIGAVVMATRSLVRNPGHNYLPGDYYDRQPVAKQRVDMAWAVGLRDFLHNASRYNRGYTKFGAQERIEQAKNKFDSPCQSLKLSYKGFRNPAIIAAMNAVSDPDKLQAQCESLAGKLRTKKKKKKVKAEA